MAISRVQVIAFFRARMGQFQRAVRQGTLIVRALEHRLARVKHALHGVGHMVMFPAAAGIGYMAKKAIELNKELETTKIGIATMLQQSSRGGRGPFEDFATGLGLSNRLMRTLQDRAAKLPGTTQDFRRGFELLLPVVAKTGGSVEDVLKLSEKVVVAAKVNNVFGGAETVARDINQILSGSVAINQLQTFALRDDAKRIAQLARKDRAAALREISQALEVSPEALVAFESTFDAKWSTFKDNLSRILTNVGGPAFDVITRKLGEWNAWLAANEQRVNAIAKEVGDKIVDGARKFVGLLKDAKGVVDDIGKHWGLIKDTIATIATVWLGGKVWVALKNIAIAVGTNPILLAVFGIPAAIAAAALLDKQDPLADAAVEKGAKLIRLTPTNRQIEAFRERRREDALSFDELRVWTATEKELRQKHGDRSVSRDMDMVARETLVRIAKTKKAEIEAQVESRKKFAAAGQFKGLPETGFNPARLSDADRLEAAAENLHKKFKNADRPHIDARGSTFRIEQNFDEGDPDRVALGIRRGIMQPFLPMLTSTVGIGR
ncbi:MAG: hypothetical protein Q8R92_21095 [Deltaproteobacteria bacterium]|nr:hypothetical protein [Deltaproteobacteria bacterium]